MDTLLSMFHLHALCTLFARSCKSNLLVKLIGPMGTHEHSAPPGPGRVSRSRVLRVERETLEVGSKPNAECAVFLSSTSSSALSPALSSIPFSTCNCETHHDFHWTNHPPALRPRDLRETERRPTALIPVPSPEETQSDERDQAPF